MARPGAPGSTVMSAGSGGGWVQDVVEGILRAGGIVSVGLGQVSEAAVAAHDGDSRVGQAREIARQVAHMCPTTVFIVSEVAHVVQTVFDVPVVPDQGQELLGTGALSRQTVKEFPGSVVPPRSRVPSHTQRMDNVRFPLPRLYTPRGRSASRHRIRTPHDTDQAALRAFPWTRSSMVPLSALRSTTC